jgi:Protein of unknown function (DUF2750)
LGCAVSGGVRKTCVIPELTGKEFAAVIRLPAPRRYEYFVKKVADRDTMWGLCDGDGWVTSADDSGNLHVPLWPHPGFAAACAIEEWAQARPESIDVDEWIEGGAAQLENDGLAVGVFPTPEGLGVAVSALRLKDDLENEQSKFLL